MEHAIIDGLLGFRIDKDIVIWKIQEWNFNQLEVLSDEFIHRIKHGVALNRYLDGLKEAMVDL